MQNYVLYPEQTEVGGRYSMDIYSSSTALLCAQSPILIFSNEIISFFFLCQDFDLPKDLRLESMDNVSDLQ